MVRVVFFFGIVVFVIVLFGFVGSFVFGFVFFGFFGYIFENEIV